MNDLEHALRELDVDWPATPDLARRGARADRGEPRRAGAARGAARRAAPPCRAGALAALVARSLGGTLAVSPAARSTVLAGSA